MTQPTFTRKKHSRYILAIAAGVVIVLLIVAVIVLAVLLARKDDGHTKEQKPRSESGFPMYVSTFESFGLSNNSLRLSLSYTAPKHHTTDWTIRYHEGDIYRTVGTIKNIGENENVFSTQVDIPDFSDVSLVFLRIYSTVEIISINFNLSALTNKGSAEITGWRNEIVHIDDKIKPTTNSNLTFNLTLKIDPDVRRMLIESSASVVEGISEMADMFLSGLNTTAEPPVVFEVVQGIPGNALTVSSEITRSNGTLIDLAVTVSSEYVQYGGLLTLSIEDNASTVYISKIKHGVSTKVLSLTTDDVVPNNVVGIFPLQNETYIYSKRRTLICFAMGNPHPEVTIFKLDQSQEYQVDQEELLSVKYAHLVGFTVETNDQKNLGRYICRVKSNQATAETTTEVRLGELPVINVTETGVTENSTDKIIIKCQASGIPRPDIHLNLFRTFGPDLVRTGLYQVNTSSPDSNTLVVTLTISPPDPAIHTVYCVPSQNDSERGKPVKIQLFPFDETNEIDWDLYNQMMNLIYDHSSN